MQYTFDAPAEGGPAFDDAVRRETAVRHQVSYWIITESRPVEARTAAVNRWKLTLRKTGVLAFLDAIVKWNAYDYHRKGHGEVITRNSIVNGQPSKEAQP